MLIKYKRLLLTFFSSDQRDIMLIDDVFPVLVDDALLTSHPIIVDVSTPSEITSVFDAISYSKVCLCHGFKAVVG